ncbi:Putative inhibitor of growth histone-binding protein [Septoria linicola]|uniref:Chromatin modification-related protein n=1 Tax=Septoria linicola TaxID=215465 RepID=A0A9Q9AMR6_9PEZI|nr:putative inhibitor of growth histone-binding protein [Septoria linicola]USW48958.1 Putative inhibitor of growth histone-binding protein [Septoria linicola]
MASLAQPEDAASVLEQFTHDIANIPAEVTHLLEEIQAKDLQIAAFKDEIHKRDAQLQKWVRVNGGHVLNPKEEAFSKTINDCYDKCEILQAEKCGLSEKAQIVLDRQIKRLDVGLRGLAQTEQFPSDWTGPSLLTPSGTAGPNTPAAVVVPNTGPLQAVSGNIGSTGGAPNFANAAQLRLAQNAAAGARSTAASGAVTPVATARSQREGSTDANKRRRLNASLGSLPAASSHLRQSSLGPGTPKAGTPVPSGAANSSRAGSAQPTRPPANKKGTQPVAVPTRKAPPPSKKSRSRPSHNKKSSRHRQLARDRATPSTNNSNESDAESEGSYASNTASNAPAGQDGAGDAEEEDDGGDDTIYCICQKVSFGAMVGCDNDNCPYQWFHYKCVGVTEEPSGEWLCPQCRSLPKNKIKIAK